MSSLSQVTPDPYKEVSKELESAIHYLEQTIEAEQNYANSYNAFQDQLKKTQEIAQKYQPQLSALNALKQEGIPLEQKLDLLVQKHTFASEISKKHLQCFLAKIKESLDKQIWLPLLEEEIQSLNKNNTLLLRKLAYSNEVPSNLKKTANKCYLKRAKEEIKKRTLALIEEERQSSSEASSLGFYPSYGGGEEWINYLEGRTPKKKREEDPEKSLEIDSFLFVLPTSLSDSFFSREPRSVSSEKTGALESEQTLQASEEPSQEIASFSSK